MVVLKFAVMSAVLVVPAGLAVHLKGVGEQGIGAQRDLQAVATELQIQDGWEWRAISGRVTPQDVRVELSRSRLRARSLLELAGAGGLDSTEARQIGRLTQSYSEAVDHELGLIEAGELDEASEYDEAEVDPAFTRAVDALTRATELVSAKAGRAGDLSDVGVLLTVLLSLGLTSMVQSRRRRAEVLRQSERRSQARYQALVAQSADLLFVLDDEGRARFLSPSAERLVGLDEARHAVPADGVPFDLMSVVDPRDQAALAGALQQVGSHAVTSLEIRLVTRSGSRRFDASITNLTEDSAVGGLVLTAHDVTERCALQEEMEYRALHDTLTGLPNRALLADRFDVALRSAEAGTVAGLLLIDLDRFKEINDTFGHHYGDDLLTQVGPRLAQALRAGDTIARLGGDEFAVLLPDVGSLQNATDLAARLGSALEAPFRINDVDLYVEASIGVVVSGLHGLDSATLLQRADIAMYVAKADNHVIAVYDPESDGNSPARLTLITDLRRALESDELILHFQPKVSISSGSLVGAEALVRWQHPRRGLVFPDEFIPLAEHTGLIGPLTHYVLDRALAQARVWVDSGDAVPISVNLSARNLLDDGLPDRVAQLLEAHGVPASLLQLEVTESALMSDPERAQSLLERLVVLGVRISIDDFGVGYTSLSQLKTLPVTELKIDKSFVLTMMQDRSNALIVNSIVELGHNLGLSIVAEGVESEHAFTALSTYGCDVAQGYLLSRPVPASELDQWRARRHNAGASTAVAATVQVSP